MIFVTVCVSTRATLFRFGIVCPQSRNGLAHANATRDAGLAEELFWTVLTDIQEKYPQFISGGRHYPGMLWRFKRAIHVVDRISC